MLLNLLKSQKKLFQKNSFAKGTPSPAASKILSEKNIPISSVSGMEEVGELQRTMH